MPLVRLLRSLPSFRPGIAYVNQGTLYLAPTTRSPVRKTLRSCRGPGFAAIDTTVLVPAARTSPPIGTVEEESGLAPLPLDAPEPTAEEFGRLVEEFYAARTDTTTTTSSSSLGSMGEQDGGVVFHGDGDPLWAIDVVLETVRYVAARRNGIAFRVNTFGLVPSDNNDHEKNEDVITKLVTSGVVACGDTDQRRETRIATVSVFVPAATPHQYDEILQPKNEKTNAFAQVCAFIAQLADAGVHVECTTVDRPEIPTGAIEALTRALGATSFQTRSCIP